MFAMKSNSFEILVPHLANELLFIANRPHPGKIGNPRRECDI
jgi:hypothetical protein